MYIYVEGFWSTNLGDDIFLKILCERYPNALIETTMVNKHKQPFKNLSNLRIVGLPEYSNKFGMLVSKAVVSLEKLIFRRGFYIYNRFFFKLTSKPDVYIEIGGSIFMFKKDEEVRKSFAYKRRKKIIEQVKHYFIIGSNFGPYYSEDQLDEYGLLYRKMDEVCFRDEYSKKLFEYLPNVRYEADVVLNLSVPDVIPEGEFILFSLIDIKSKPDPEVGDYRKKAAQYFNVIREMIMNYISNGEKVILFSFCDVQGDAEISKKLLSSFSAEERKSIIVEHHRTIDDSLNIIKNAKKIIATRFHAMILGWLYQKPTFAISYNDKTINTIESLFPEQNYMSYLDLEHLTFDFLESSFSRIDDKTLSILKQSAKRQFNELDTYIGESSS